MDAEFLSRYENRETKDITLNLLFSPIIQHLKTTLVCPLYSTLVRVYVFSSFHLLFINVVLKMGSMNPQRIHRRLFTGLRTSKWIR